jgi:hypothetical protein
MITLMKVLLDAKSLELDWVVVSIRRATISVPRITVKAEEGAGTRS